ncbi:NAD(P)/FAD-dependent oxidoreductase [Billgrantia endophytica]|uniref:D-amino-acid oxidase n=1 Tax=Billgrantia endophytica TaxID=2033802 RepID=A0A2N7U7X9_9GAMM|nr:FAD-binding oxidoreductase [Halomonas endophytica]PMR76528.1 D-amino-acid oxidase [Halomonas endophytica]
MGPNVDNVESTPAFPTRAEVVVIGGGIVGVATALALVDKGVDTVLLEKGVVAAEQSSRNWGWCRRTGRDLRELPLIEASMQMWEGMNQRLGRECGFRRHGIVYAAHDEKQFERHGRWREAAAEHGIDSRLLDAGQMRRLVPGLQGPVFGGLHTPADGRAEPQKAAPAMAQAAIERGLNLQQHCAVRSIERAGGRIERVVTEHGEIACQSVVIAGGAWSRLLLAGLGVTLPQLKVRSSVLRTRPLAVDVEPCLSLGRVALRKRLDGGWTIASSSNNLAEVTPDALRFLRLFWPAYRVEREILQPHLGRQGLDEVLRWRPGQAERVSIYERIRVLDPAPHRPTLVRMVEDLKRALPAFAGLQVAQSWAGLIDTLPDAIPVISTVENVPGCLVATGFSGHGFGIAPAAGQLAADLITGDVPCVDPEPFRLERFRHPHDVRAQHWL